MAGILRLSNCRKTPMNCVVYRSSLKDFTYIYLLDGHAYEDLPAALRKVFGEPRFVMQLDLTPERKLANENVGQVMQNLSECGYHLQLPPNEDPSGWLDLPSAKETLL